MTKDALTIHPDWLAQVERDGKLTVSARVTFTAKTGLTHLAAAENLEKVRELLLAEADVAVKRLTRARDPQESAGVEGRGEGEPVAA